MTHRALISAASIDVAALAFSACSGDGIGARMGSGSHQNSSEAQNAPRRAGPFRLDEWSITADSTHFSSGSQAITTLKTGHQTHELVIVKAPDAAPLPTKTDGSIDEQALAAENVGEIADAAAGSSRQAISPRKRRSVLQYHRHDGDGPHGAQPLRTRDAHHLHRERHMSVRL
jgi:hypothetical protein